MRYDEIREHVREHLRAALVRFKEQVDETGPLDQIGLASIKNTRDFAAADPETWLDYAHADGAGGLLSAFCRQRGLSEANLTDDDRAHILAELQKGYRAYAEAALEKNASLGSMELGTDPERPPMPPQSTPEAGPGYREVVSRYFSEIARAGALAATTESSKRDALDLLGKITGDKPLSRLTRSDAQAVKEVLLRLPADRNKSPRTRGLSLEQMLAGEGVRVISARTVNVYIGAMQTFCIWAVNNGYAAENVFTGMRVKVSKRAKEQGREAFSTDQLRTLFAHLTENPEELVRKDTHKWGVLIGMFTGMRLNEIAQLRVDDVVCVDGTWVPVMVGLRLLGHAGSRRMRGHFGREFVQSLPCGRSGEQAHECAKRTIRALFAVRSLCSA